MKQAKTKTNKNFSTLLKVFPRSASGTYFVIDKTRSIKTFSTEGAKEIKLLHKPPHKGQAISEIIPPKYFNILSLLIDYCFDGNSFNLKRELKRVNGTNRELQIIFTPLAFEEEVDLIVVNLLLDELITFKRGLSFVTSHQLRAPVCNILSLSDLLVHPKLSSPGYKEIRNILHDINQQARQLDKVLIELNELINQDEFLHAFPNRRLGGKNDHIMLVDDDPMVNKLHQKLLARYANKTVVAFTNPLDALSYIERTPPELVFLDLNMPLISGFEFLEKLQQKSRQVSVVIVSSSIDTSERIRASTYEIVKDFLGKPLTSEKIETLLL